MSKKVVLNVAEKLSELRHIPLEKLPSTLKTEIKLDNIQEVKLHYRPMCKNVGPSLQFMRQFAPALRYYNPDLNIYKNKDSEGPIAMTMEIFKKGSQEPVTIIPNEYKKAEEILEKIKEINSQQ